MHTIGSVVLRARYDVVASIVSVHVVRRPALMLNVVVDDGSGRLLCQFLGRSAVPGFVEGRRLRVAGRVATFRGHRSLLNPAYEFVDDSLGQSEASPYPWPEP